jgi:hypothetical protein
VSARLGVAPASKHVLPRTASRVGPMWSSQRGTVDRVGAGFEASTPSGRNPLTRPPHSRDRRVGIRPPTRGPRARPHAVVPHHHSRQSVIHPHAEAHGSAAAPPSHHQRGHRRWGHHLHPVPDRQSRKGQRLSSGSVTRRKCPPLANRWCHSPAFSRVLYPEAAIEAAPGDPMTAHPQSQKHEIRANEPNSASSLPSGPHARSGSAPVCATPEPQKTMSVHRFTPKYDVQITRHSASIPREKPKADTGVTRATMPQLLGGHGWRRRA